MRRAGVTMGYFDEVLAVSPMVEGTQLTGSKAAIYLSRQDGGNS